MHSITHTCTCYVTNQNLIIIFRGKKVIQPWFEKTWVTLPRCIYEPNFIEICAAVWEKSKMCLTQSVNWNRKYRSQQPNLNKLEIRPTGDSPNQIWMISGQWFYRRRIGQKLHKITHNSMKNRGSTRILTHLVGVHPRNIHTKLEANPWSGLREEVEKLKKFTPTTTTTTMTTTDTGWSLESHSLVECD